MNQIPTRLRLGIPHCCWIGDHPEMRLSRLVWREGFLWVLGVGVI